MLLARNRQGYAALCRIISRRHLDPNFGLRQALLDDREGVLVLSDCLADGDVAVLTPNGVKLTDFAGHPVTRRVQHISWDPILAEKGGFRHYMVKEIYEQPRAVRDTTLGRVQPEKGQIFLDEMEISEEDFRSFREIKIVAAGSSPALRGFLKWSRTAALNIG